MEHISEHLKAHAANDSDFRSLIGEPRMGKVRDARSLCYWFNIVIFCISVLDWWDMCWMCIIHH